MSLLTLMSRARETLQRRAGTSALIIVPLALVVPAHASSVFLFGSNYVTSGFSGGALGNANSVFGPGGLSVQMTGDTLTTSSPGSYVTAGEAVDSAGGIDPTSPTSSTAHIVYTWQGTFAPGSTNGPPDALWLTTNISTLISPNDGQDTVAWSLDANIMDPCDNVLVDETVSSSEAGNSFVQPFVLSGTSDTWTVTLDVQWTFPTTTDMYGAHAVFPNDQLDANSVIDMTILSGGEGLPAVPLPPAVWTGGSLLGFLLAGMSFRKWRTRQTD